MEFRILGPVEVVDDGRPISIRRGKQLALLAYLLLRPNELVPSERLIDELWDENPPPTAAKVLQNAVSELRKALGEDRLLTRPPGYMLRVEPGELDLERFELLARRGRGTGDPELLREALALWHGDALADLRDEPFAQRASAQLEEGRLAAQEDRLDADLASGRHADLVPELEALIARHPFDERLYRQLMLALYRAGRQADALAVYQRARQTFDEELGLQPSPELEELQHQILNQDAGLTALSRSKGGIVRRPSRRRALLVAFALLVGGGALALVLVLLNTRGGVPRVTKDSLVKIDPETGDILDVVRVGRQPVAVAVLGDFVFVSNVQDATITRLDSKTGDTDTTGGLRPPLDLVPDGVRHLWTTTYGYEQVTRIDARTLQADLVVPLGLRTFLLGTGAGSLWVTEQPANLGENGSVARINLRTATVERRAIRVGPAPVDVKVGLGAAWVTNGADASVSRINLRDLSVERIPVGISPGPLAIAFESVWFIAGQTNDTVWRLNPATRQPDAVIKVGKGPFNIEADAYGVWAALRDSGTIVRIDPRTNTVTKRVHLGYKPQGMAVGAGALWVSVGHGDLGSLG